MLINAKRACKKINVRLGKYSFLKEQNFKKMEQSQIA